MGTDQSVPSILMMSQRRLGIPDGIPLALKVIFTVMALIVQTNWLIELNFCRILLRASCDKYKTPLENAFEDGWDSTRSPVE